MLRISEIKANREAGTPGPWMHGHFADDDHPCDCRSILGEHGGMGSLATMTVDNGLAIGDGGNDGPDLSQSQSNARRIARVPDLEAAVLDGAEEMAEFCRSLIEAASNQDLDHEQFRIRAGENAAKALAAYREHVSDA